MVDNIEDKVLVREFDDGRDIEVVGKLEKNCDIGSNNKGASIFTNMTGDPLCRIGFYPLHLMLANGDRIKTCESNGRMVDKQWSTLYLPGNRKE
ncbi:hypothetical protein SCA6_015688 [Theobroma cacao]